MNWEIFWITICLFLGGLYMVSGLNKIMVNKEMGAGTFQFILGIVGWAVAAGLLVG